MKNDLLSTKFYIPELRADHVTRPHLIKLLNEGLNKKLILISAPTGFGKTALLSEWIRQSECSVAWVTLDRNDNDPGRFFAYLISAFQEIHPGIGSEILAVIREHPQPSLGGLLTVLINDIHTYANPIVLVLDDFHVITESRIHDFVYRILENSPSNLHLIISSRADPPWPLARLRAQAQLTEIRVDELRFLPAEVFEFLNELMGLDLTPHDITILEERTEGWIAGLQMAALSMKNHPNSSKFIEDFSGSHRYILDYLVEEVIQQQSDETRLFLMQTSILDRMCVPLCAAVLGKTSAEELEELRQLLDYLDRANLFVVPLDDDRIWYRYNHLFSDLLRHKLMQQQADEVEVLHNRASMWFESQKSISEAVQHALMAKDYVRVAKLVQNSAVSMLVGNEQYTLLKWLDALPDNEFSTNPWLSVFQAWTNYFLGKRDLVDDYLKNASNALKAVKTISKPEGDRVTGSIASVRSLLSLSFEDVESALENAKTAIVLLPLGDYFRSIAGIALGGGLWATGDIPKIQGAFSDAAESARKGGFRSVAVSALCYVGSMMEKKAQLLQAQSYYQNALELAKVEGNEFPSGGFPLVRLGSLYLEWNDIRNARSNIYRGIELADRWGQPDILAEAYVILANLQMAQGDLSGSENNLGEARSLTVKTTIDPWVRTGLDASLLRLWELKDDFESINRWVSNRAQAKNSRQDYLYDFPGLNLAKALLVQYKIEPKRNLADEILGILEQVETAAQSAGWINKLIRVFLLRSITHRISGDMQAALGELRSCLSLAMPACYVRTILDEGEHLADMLVQVTVDREIGGYAERLISEIESEREGNIILAATDKLDQSFLPEPLSERELEVLKLLGTSMSTSEIADRLYIAVSTVRTHVKKIYSKLDAHSRIEALEKAREIDLL